MKHYKIILTVSIALLTLATFVVAATGRVDGILKYAWSSKIGWINFAPTDGSGNYIGPLITDNYVTGYAWSPNFGWINFNPTNGGVINNTSGTLSGSAWGQNTGWIDFSGAVINCDGQF